MIFAGAGLRAAQAGFDCIWLLSWSQSGRKSDSGAILDAEK